MGEFLGSGTLAEVYQDISLDPELSDGLHENSASDTETNPEPSDEVHEDSLSKPEADFGPSERELLFEEFASTPMVYIGKDGTVHRAVGAQQALAMCAWLRNDRLSVNVLRYHFETAAELANNLPKEASEPESQDNKTSVDEPSSENGKDDHQKADSVKEATQKTEVKPADQKPSNVAAEVLQQSHISDTLQPVVMPSSTTQSAVEKRDNVKRSVTKLANQKSTVSTATSKRASGVNTVNSAKAIKNTATSFAGSLVDAEKDVENNVDLPVASEQALKLVEAVPQALVISDTTNQEVVERGSLIYQGADVEDMDGDTTVILPDGINEYDESSDIVIEADHSNVSVFEDATEDSNDSLTSQTQGLEITNDNDFFDEKIDLSDSGEVANESEVALDQIESFIVTDSETVEDANKLSAVPTTVDQLPVAIDYEDRADSIEAEPPGTELAVDQFNDFLQSLSEQAGTDTETDTINQPGNLVAINSSLDSKEHVSDAPKIEALFTCVKAQMNQLSIEERTDVLASKKLPRHIQKSLVDLLEEAGVPDPEVMLRLYIETYGVGGLFDITASTIALTPVSAQKDHVRGSTGYGRLAQYVVKILMHHGDSPRVSTFETAA